MIHNTKKLSKRHIIYITVT